jgi:predicted dinucleotide-binding enzyme
MNRADHSTVGILGAGRLGQAMARTARRAGRPDVGGRGAGRSRVGGDSGRRRSSQNRGHRRAVGQRPGRPRRTPMERSDRHRRHKRLRPPGPRRETSSEVLADLVGDAPTVKAANTLGAAVLGADPHEAGGQRVIFLSGDDTNAKAEVSALFQDAGFFTIDLGDLITGGKMQQIGAPLAGANLIRLPDSDQSARGCRSGPSV